MYGIRSPSKIGGDRTGPFNETTKYFCISLAASPTPCMYDSKKYGRFYISTAGDILGLSFLKQLLTSKDNLLQVNLCKTSLFYRNSFFIELSFYAYGTISLRSYQLYIHYSSQWTFLLITKILI